MAKTTKTKAELEKELNEVKSDALGLTSSVRVLENKLKTSQYLHQNIVNDWNSMIAAIRSAFGVEAFSDGSMDSSDNLIWSFRDVTTGEILLENIKHADIGAGYIQSIKKRAMIPDRGMLDAIQKCTPGTDLTYLANQFIIPLWLTAFQSSQHEAEQLQKIVASCYNRDGTV